jgi:hypothetical protein
MASIEVRGLTKRSGDVVAVASLSPAAAAAGAELHRLRTTQAVVRRDVT